MNGKSWEQQVVDEIIAAEARIEFIIREINYLEHVQFENGFFDTYSQWIDDKVDELQSELADLQKVVGNE